MAHLNVYSSPETFSSTDLIERLEELRDNAEFWDESDKEEYDMLHKINVIGEDHNGEWSSGVDLIRSDYFPDYIKDDMIQLGFIEERMLEYICVDWEATAEKVMFDYYQVTIVGDVYYFRIS